MNRLMTFGHIPPHSKSFPALGAALLAVLSPVPGGARSAVGAGASTALSRGAAPYAVRPAPIGTVRYIRGGLLVQPPGHARERGKVNMALYDRYFLETGAGQAASLRFRDGTTLYMNQRTDITLRTIHLTSVRRGEVDEVVVQGTNHKVGTAQAVAVARGTNFDVRVKGHRASYFVIHGAIEVSDSKGAVTVQPNEKTVVTANAAPQPPTPANGQAAIAWTKGLPVADVVQVTSVSPEGFQVTYTSKQPGRGQILFGMGPGCNGLVELATKDLGSGTRLHSILVTGNDLGGSSGSTRISPGYQYFFEVETVTALGTETDNNHGKCYSVQVPRVRPRALRA